MKLYQSCNLFFRVLHWPFEIFWAILFGCSPVQSVCHRSAAFPSISRFYNGTLWFAHVCKLNCHYCFSQEIVSEENVPKVDTVRFGARNAELKECLQFLSLDCLPKVNKNPRFPHSIIIEILAKVPNWFILNWYKFNKWRFPHPPFVHPNLHIFYSISSCPLKWASRAWLCCMLTSMVW